MDITNEISFLSVSLSHLRAHDTIRRVKVLFPLTMKAQKKQKSLAGDGLSPRGRREDGVEDLAGSDSKNRQKGIAQLFQNVVSENVTSRDLDESSSRREGGVRGVNSLRG